MTALTADLDLALLLSSPTREQTPAAAREPSPTVAAVTDDDALCAAALAGDRDAWDRLIQRHDHRVVVSLLARGVRVDRAHELAQETWILLLRRQRAGRLTMLKLPGLALAQAQFLWREDLRRAQAHPPAATLDEGRHGGGGAEGHDLDPRLDPEARLLAREQLARARDVLSGCSRSTQTVFHLLYETPGLSHADAAQKAGLSLQRVRQILCNLRKKLRAALHDDDAAAGTAHDEPSDD